jgi:hypothetical protein
MGIKESVQSSKYTTISAQLAEFGFQDSSYKYFEKTRVSMFSSSSSELYGGWKSFPTAPIIREAKWWDVFKKNQTIKISNKFTYIKPIKLRSSLFSSAANWFIKLNPQYDNSSELEFQNILSIIENGSQRPTTLEDVSLFDFEASYKIIKIDAELGVAALCHTEKFKYIHDGEVDFENMIFFQSTLFTFVDLIELIPEAPI